MQTMVFLRTVIANLLLSLCLAFLVANPAWALFTLKAEANPDPVAPLQVLDTQISISTTAATGALTLRVFWPAELGRFPIVTSGGTCPSGCDAGDFLSWDLGVLGADSSVTVSFTEAVLSAVADDTLIGLDIELLENAAIVDSLALSIEVQSNSPLELVIDPLPDPVPSGALQVYEIIFANIGEASARNSLLEFPIPAGSLFVSATGGGVFAAGSVSWDLGNLVPNSGSRERVTVQVDALSDGTLLVVDAATLSADVNFLPKESRAMAVSRVGSSSIELDLEINPDPLKPDQVMDAQITVGNPGGSATGALSLRVLWPEELGRFPIITAGGSCPSGCDAGDYLSWDLGVLGPQSSVTVSFNEAVRNTIINGTLIPLEVELFENGLAVRNSGHTVITQSDAPLELAIDPLPDPVSSGGTLVYELVYGNTGLASIKDGVLNFPVPAGTQFLSATGAGVHDSGNVSWSFGNMLPNSGGRERVSVQVDTLNDGSLLLVDAATLSGVANSIPTLSQAMAVSHTGSATLELDLEINPDPVAPGELIESQFTVSNPTGSATGTLSLRVLWPEELGRFPVTTGGGLCPSGCDPGDYLTWDLGVLGPALSVTVGFTETVGSNVVDGTLIPLEVELFEGGVPAGNNSHTVITQSESPLELSVDPLPDPVASGGMLIYEIVYGNTGVASADNSSLRFPIPVGTQFQSTTGGAVLENGSLHWSIGSLAPNSGGKERVTVSVDALADGTLLVVDAAILMAEFNFIAKQARAMVVSRVATGLLDLDLHIDPNPVLATQELNVDITIDNPNNNATGTLTLRVLWPEELGRFPAVAGGGLCPSACDPGDYLFWDLGVLGPATSVTVGFIEPIRSGIIDGTLFPLEVELLEGGLPVRNTSETILVNQFDDNDNDGEADVFDEDDDNDGIPDWWENLHGLDPFDASDAGEDPDGDGATNLEEYLAGTDPNSNDDIIFKNGFES